jgi:predicted transcriptional regulator
MGRALSCLAGEDLLATIDVENNGSRLDTSKAISCSLSGGSSRPCPASTARPAGSLDPAGQGGYTPGMKTAVSLPDEVFTSAERLAKRLKISRSQLYGRAIDEYVARHAPDVVTEALDRVCESLEAREESELVTAASRRILEQTEW